MKNPSNPGTKFTLLFASTLTVMSAALIAPSLPQMAEAFGGDEEASLLAKTVLTAPAIVIAFFSPVAGWLLDRFGKMRIFLPSLILYAVAGSAGLYLETPDAFLLSRGLFGLMVAIVMTTTTTLVGDYFEGEERSKFIGFQSAAMALGAGALVFLAGSLADLNWRYPFGVYLTAIIVLFFAIKYLWEPEKREEKALSKNDLKHPISAPKVPLLPVATVYIATFIGLLLFYLIPTQSTFLLKSMGVESNALASGGLIIATIFAGATALIYPYFKRRMTYGKIYSLCFVLIGTGFLLVSYATSSWAVILALVITGIGSGFFMPNASLCLMALSPESHRGRVIGGMVSVAFLGQFLSPIAVQPVLEATSLSEVFFWGAMLALAISGVFLLVKLK